MSKCTDCGNENGAGATLCAGCGRVLALDEDETGIDPGDVQFSVAVLRTFATETGARMALGALEQVGITAYLGTDDCGGMLPSLQHAKGIRLLVDASELEKARTFLTEWESAPSLQGDPSASLPSRASGDAPSPASERG